MRALAAPSPASALLQQGNDADLAHQPDRAYVFYRMAAQAGIPEAEFNVAVMNDSGVGVGRNAAQAALWYARAASHGYERAFYNLGELAASGEGLPRNPALARAWFAAAGATSRARSVSGGPEPPAPPAPVLDEVQADLPGPDDTVPVELVWHVAEMPGDTSFFVQVVRLDTSGRHDVAWTATPVAALVLPMPRSAGLYAWRVLASSAATGHYTMSSWASFRLR